MPTLDIVVGGKTEKAVVLDANAKIEPSFITTGTPSGVAPLGTASKVPMAFILTNTAGGLPLLDGNGKVAAAQLPASLPSARRYWYNVKSARSISTWVTHNGGGGNEMLVYARSAGSTQQSRELRGEIRSDAAGTVFTFQSDAVDVAGERWLHLYMSVPFNWQYRITSNGGSTNATMGTWYEMY